MSDYGELVATDTVKFVRELPGPIERVWSYLVEADKRKRWLCDGNTDTHSGGRVEMLFDNSTLARGADDIPPPKYEQYAGPVRFTGTITAYEPPAKLSHTWEFEGESSEVTYELTESGSTVILTLTHRRLASQEEVLGVCGGWHTHLDILGEILEGRESLGFWKRHTRFEGEYGERLGISERVP